ncbi:hypothetical protein [Nevskia soli]|uniref:hypothetical protein n=1 Tax=Nevskia soli TaxID=418856 RepID=UPI0015D8CC3A|nr:hypothetical protein [Nevskia soli]
MPASVFDFLKPREIAVPSIHPSARDRAYVERRNVKAEYVSTYGLRGSILPYNNAAWESCPYS